MINPVVRWAFYVFAFSIPIEYPTPLPFQIHTATAAVLLMTALVLEPSLFRRPSAAVYWIGAYLWVYTALVLVSEHASEAARLLARPVEEEQPPPPDLDASHIRRAGEDVVHRRFGDAVEGRRPDRG